MVMMKIQYMEIKKMTFEEIVIAVVMVLYFSVGIGYAIRGMWGWAVVWLCYGGANLGLMIVKK